MSKILSSSSSINSSESESLNEEFKGHKLDWKIKILIMGCGCFMILTYFFVLALPQGIENVLLAAPYNFSNTEYGLFFACLSVPNMISPLYIGFYIDNNGLNKKMVGFLSLLLIVGAICSIWGSNSFLLLDLGNLLVGIPIENVAFICKKISADIYSNDVNVVASGVLLFFARIGQGLGSVLVPLIYDMNERLGDVYFFEVIFLIGVILSLCLSCYFLPKNEKIVKESFNAINYIKSFDKYVYLYWSICFLVIMMFFSFYTNANTYLTIAMQSDTVEVGTYLLFLVFSLGVFQIISTVLMSKIGFLNHFVIGGAIISILCWIMFILFFQVDDIYLNLIPLIIEGGVHAMNGCYYFSGTAIVVPPKKIAGALGILQCIMNFARLWGPLVFGIIRDLTMEVMSGYFYNFIVLVFYSIIIIVICLWMIRLDKIEPYKGMSDAFSKRI